MLVRGKTGFTVIVVGVLLVTRLAVLGACNRGKEEEVKHYFKQSDLL